VQAGPGPPQRKVGKVFHSMKAPSVQEGAPRRSKQNFGVLCNFQLPKSVNILKISTILFHVEMANFNLFFIGARNAGWA
jgi:hypothetical protein